MKARYIFYIIAWGIYFYILYQQIWIDQVSAWLSELHIPQEFLNITNAFFAFFFAFWIGTVVERLLQKILTFFASKTQADIDDAIIEIWVKSFRPLVYLLAIYAALYFLDIPNSSHSLKIFVSTGVIIATVVFAVNLTKYIFKEKILNNPNISKETKTTLPIIYRTIIWFIIVFWVIAILSNMGYNVNALIAGAGIWWIALALAAQSSAKNIFWIITILVNKPFEIGDYITLSQHSGVVTDLHFSYITMINDDGQTVMIPNADIIENTIKNDNRREYRRSDFSLWLQYDTDIPTLQQATSIISDILEQYVQDGKWQSYRVNFGEFWDSSLDIQVTYFSNTLVYKDFLHEMNEINMKIKEMFSQNNIIIAFPTREVIMKNS